MVKTVGRGSRGVLLARGSIHGLQEEMAEIEPDKALRFGTSLRKYQLQLVAAFEHEVAAGLRADANPIDAGRGLKRSVGLDSDFETALMESVDELAVDLQQRLAASADDIRSRACGHARPLLGNRGR